MERIYVFDTTLRDGEQSPGASMSLTQKIELSLQLTRLGVDVIEAGFPISSPIQFNACQTIAREIKGATIATLARSLVKDIECAEEAIKDAESGRNNNFIAS